jgi:PAS domain S-box-containing protein
LNRKAEMNPTKVQLPPDEEERLKALRRYEILDTEPEQEFDDITLLASHICETPIAMISLIDGDRQWFKSKIGMTACETPRGLAFCAHGILEPDWFEVEDALADERFATNPLVTGDPNIRFYAGAPLVTADGHALGMLCVIDRVPRELSPAEKAAMKALSRQVVSQLELRRNLAERKKASEALRESEERFRNYFELGLIGMAITSPAKGLIEVNDEICRILGYERSELLRMSWTEFTHPDDLAADVANFNRVVAGEIDGYSMDKRFIRKDGRVIDATISGKCLRRADGSVDYFVALLQDITERKRAEEQLRESEERMRAILESALDCIITIDHRGRVVEFNPAAEKTFGYKREAVIGQPMAELIIPPKLREQHQRGLMHYLSTGESTLLGTRAELTGMRSDNSEVPVELTITRIGSQEPPMFTGFIRDITERKLAEAALAEQAIRYKTLMETSADSIYVMNERGDLQEANAAFLRRRGYIAAEAKGLNVADWDAQWTREQLQELLQEKLSKIDDDTVLETRHRCKDGSVFDVEVSATRVRIGGEQLFFCVTRDITERKLAEEALHAAHERLGTIIQKAPLAIIAIDSTAIVQMWNPAAERLFGWTEAELVGRPIVPLIPQEDRQQFEKLIAGEIQGEVRDGLELRRLRKDGSLVDVSVWTAPLRNTRNEIVGTIGMFADITERKRAEEEQRESQLRYETLVQSIDGIVWEADPQTFTFTFVSRQAERILGYPLEQWFEGPTFWPDHMHSADRDWAVKFCVDATARGEDHQFEYRMIAADGRVVWLNDIVTLHIAPDQSVILRGLMVDITERKQADQALRESETRFRQIAENIEEVFWITDLKGSSTIYISPAYERIWGRSCESLYAEPKSWRDDIHPEDRPRMEATFASDPGSTGDYTYRIVRPDGSIRWIRDRGFPVRDESGEVVRFAGIAEDITASKLAEEELQQVNEQLRVLSRRLFQVQEEERRHLARELHDEIGQALTAAKINLNSVESIEGSAQSLRLQETIAILDRLLGQVRQISLDLRPSMLDDLGLVPALRSLLDQQGRRASVTVRFSAENMPENLDPEIQTTCFRIAQEAITNAVRHAGAAQIGVDLQGENGRLRLLVHDNGIGFDAGTAQAQTVGLGLIGIKERAALAGGQAKIISSPNQGTTIEVFLPLALRDKPASRGLRQ